MPAAYCVVRLVEDVEKGLMRHGLDCIHAFAVDAGDALVDARFGRRFLPGPERVCRARVWLVMRVPEAGSPVAEVGADYEDGGGVGQVWSEDVAVPTLTARRSRPNEDGYERGKERLVRE